MIDRSRERGAGSPDLFATVDQLVKKLADIRPTTDSRTSTRIIRPVNLPASDVKRVLERLIDQQSGSRQGGGRQSGARPKGGRKR